MAGASDGGRFTSAMPAPPGVGIIEDVAQRAGGVLGVAGDSRYGG